MIFAKPKMNIQFACRIFAQNITEKKRANKKVDQIIWGKGLLHILT